MLPSQCHYTSLLRRLGSTTVLHLSAHALWIMKMHYHKILNCLCLWIVSVVSLFAIDYIHSKAILYCYEEKNIVIEWLLCGLLIDFEKACYLKNGRPYSLSVAQRKRYARQYPQVAPGIRQGIAPQSYENDMYSFGWIHVNSGRLKLPVLGLMAIECLFSSMP